MLRRLHNHYQTTTKNEPVCLSLPIGTHSEAGVLFKPNTARGEAHVHWKPGCTRVDYSDAYCLVPRPPSCRAMCRIFHWVCYLSCTIFIGAAVVATTNFVLSLGSAASMGATNMVNSAGTEVGRFSAQFAFLRWAVPFLAGQPTHTALAIAESGVTGVIESSADWFCRSLKFWWEDVKAHGG